MRHASSGLSHFLRLPLSKALDFLHFFLLNSDNSPKISQKVNKPPKLNDSLLINLSLAPSRRGRVRGVVLLFVKEGPAVQS